MKFKTALTAVLLSTITTLAAMPVAGMAATSDANANLPKPIQFAVNRGAQVVKSFPAASGLTGWVLDQAGRKDIVYTTADKRTLIVGTLVDADGKNLSANDAKVNIPPPDYKQIYGSLEKAAYIAEGPAKPKSILYVLMDANCIYCHLTWKALLPYQKAGLQVRWLPLAFLKPTSAGRAAAIYEAHDPSAALTLNEKNFKVDTEDGGIAPLANPSQASLDKLKANEALMQALGGSGTPGVVWQQADGAVQFKDGMPTLSELPGITGLPVQAENDPDLARFR